MTIVIVGKGRAVHARSTYNPLTCGQVLRVTCKRVFNMFRMT